MITCACFERELTIKAAIIGSCEHDTSFSRNACKLCTQVCSSCERALSNSIANKEWFAVRITVVISIVPTATLGTRMTIISGFSAVVKRIPKSGMRIF